MQASAPITLALVACLAATIGAANVSAVPDRPAVSRAQVERSVLRALARGWGRRRIPALFNRHTRLLRDNTQAICRRSRRRGRFLCVVRPARHRAHEGLYVAYQALPRGRFKLRWLYYRRGR